MTFFKVIQDNKVVSVGTVFLEWNTKKHKMYVSTVDEGQFVQAYDESKVYRDAWMKYAPEEAGPFEYATVIVITQREYEDLKAMLDDKEEIVEALPEQHIETTTVQPPEEEKPMTISEMREMILKQQEQIDALTKKFN